MGGVGERGVSIATVDAATAGDIPATNARTDNAGSRHRINLACIERLLSVVNGDIACLTDGNREKRVEQNMFYG
jgi:hypothetical protein